MASTKLAYQQDGESLGYPAEILSITPVSDLPLSDQALAKDSAEIEHAVITNSTVFYMQGGGQPSDTGTMAQIVTSGGPAANPDLIFRVESVRQPAQGSQILHLGCFVPSLAPPATGFNPGSQVQQHVDAEKHNLHSCLHTAGHVLSLAIHALCREGVLVPGGSLLSKI